MYRTSALPDGAQTLPSAVRSGTAQDCSPARRGSESFRRTPNSKVKDPRVRAAALGRVEEQAVVACQQTSEPSSEIERNIKKKAAKAVLDLKRNGWAQIEDVIPIDECKDYQNGFWDWIESLGSGVQRDDPSTWVKPHWPDSYRGIINSFEVAHQAFVWRIRKHPRLREIFEELWGSGALLSSFDSINALPAGSEIGKAAWLHVDQAPTRRGHCCIQGLVNLVDVSAETTGTLLVKTGTHHEHERFFKSFSKTPKEELNKTGDHYKFVPSELQYWDDFESVAVAGKAGSLFLWDSRAVHANAFPDRTTEFRHVVYTCLQPASMATTSDLQEKRRMYDNYLISTHWPAMNVAAHGNGEDYFGSGELMMENNVQAIRTRALIEDEDLLKLAGVRSYSSAELAVKRAMIEMSEQELEAYIS